ncbi:hypothetical protein C8R45DRAFT_636244 [Mycena sanguinolenta]|nr:hypothetical protein C8R45DRAFT_636244 [Mycena sanguinolenta]
MPPLFSRSFCFPSATYARLGQGNPLLNSRPITCIRRRALPNGALQGESGALSARRIADGGGRRFSVAPSALDVQILVAMHDLHATHSDIEGTLQSSVARFTRNRDTINSSQIFCTLNSGIFLLIYRLPECLCADSSETKVIEISARWRLSRHCHRPHLALHNPGKSGQRSLCHILTLVRRQYRFCYRDYLSAMNCRGWRKEKSIYILPGKVSNVYSTPLLQN